MDQRTVSVLFALLRSAISETKLTEAERAEYSPELLSDLLKISAKHDVDHLLVWGLQQNGLLSNEERSVEKRVLKAVYRYERTRYEYESLCAALENAQIPFLPLKGSVIRSYYPKPWMRTSCDIDVLVHEENLQRATDYLTEHLGYRVDSTFTHDVSLFTQSGWHIELHYNLMEDEPIKSSSNVLRNVWDYATKREDREYWYELSDAAFYFYHIAHMAKHFENGGCGIRPFIDLYVLNRRISFDAQARSGLLQKGDLVTFARQAKLLAEVWFEGAEHCTITRQMEHYILRGGVYGTIENHIAVQQHKRGGKIKYALSKIWLPYDTIKFYYPILEKHKWLLPFMEMRRWFRLIFCGHWKRVTRELKYSSAVSKHEADETKLFLSSIGL